MATPAQMQANRANAQKSTGPRTSDGKAVVAQNAVKHGLRAREGVLRGEDLEEFEQHREALLEELNPTGTLEVLLATRIVDLTWRLHRAAEDRNETFGALYDRHTAGAPEPEGVGPAERGATLGRMILEDYSGEAVLERLLRCERRIEGSLFRSLHELRRVHDQQCKADAEAASTLARWRDEDDRARKERAFAPWRPMDSPARPDGPTMGTPDFGPSRASGSSDEPSRAGFAAPQECDDLWGPDTPAAADAAAGNEICQTNPIGPEPDTSQVLCGTAVRSVSAPEGLRKTNPMGSAPCGPGILPASPKHGRDAHATHGQDAHATLGRGAQATKPPEGGTPNGVGNEICQTNPIGPEPDTSQVLCGTAVRSVSAPEGLRKTNPMGSVPCGPGILPASPKHGRDAHATHGQDAHATGGRDAQATHGQDAHATLGRDARATGGRDAQAAAPPGGDGVNLAADQGRFATCSLAGFQQGTMTGACSVRRPDASLRSA